MAEIADLLARLPGGGAGGVPSPAGGGAPTPAPAGVPRAAPAGLGPVASPQGQAGNAANALVEVRNAIMMLEKALPNIPMGTPLHTDLLQVTAKLSRHIKSDDASSGLSIQSLLQLAREQSKSAPGMALARMQPTTPASPALPNPGAAGGGLPTAAAA